MDRYYWNVVATAAAPAVASMTERLNSARVPFRLKIVNDPDEFGRADAGILYLPREARAQAAPIIRRVHEDVAAGLGDEVPAFTLPLAGGVGFAESPGRGRSFGMTRCRLLADGILHAHSERAPDGEGVRVVARAFAREGLSCDAPYLEAGSPAPIDWALA